MTKTYDEKLNNERTERIKKLREERGMTQTEMAIMIDREPRTYNKYETNNTPWNLEMIETIAKAWDISPLFLLYGYEKEIPSMSETDHRILEVLSKYSEEGKQQILKAIILFMNSQNMTK